jgi:hypothetical protein
VKLRIGEFKTRRLPMPQEGNATSLVMKIELYAHSGLELDETALLAQPHSALTTLRGRVQSTAGLQAVKWSTLIVAEAQT